MDVSEGFHVGGLLLSLTAVLTWLASRCAYLAFLRRRGLLRGASKTEYPSLQSFRYHPDPSVRGAWQRDRFWSRITLALFTAGWALGMVLSVAAHLAESAHR